jgi:hypothetical protein
MVHAKPLIFNCFAAARAREHCLNEKPPKKIVDVNIAETFLEPLHTFLIKTDTHTVI